MWLDMAGDGEEWIKEKCLILSERKDGGKSNRSEKVKKGNKVFFPQVIISFSVNM